MNHSFTEVFIVNVKMLKYITLSIGFLAQLLFSSRMIIQWISAEKNKKVTSDLIFWQVSLVASFFLFIYGYLRHDFSIMLGQVITYYIYIRNIQLHNAWMKYHIVFRYFVYFFPILAISLALWNGTINTNKLFSRENIPLWLLIWGSLGQVLFTMRFIYQWIYSERIKKSELPLGFWILSLTGSLMIFIYSIIRKDPVLFAGHCMGIIVYTRNIIIVRKSNYAE
ncbi:lipid-A-disaccharide synthase N-terminal domain-containing protein [Apibacter raozihei]|uniref:lipid-A-disaccharide synthase N-terminal domain-containing protein n=1 Tax=Apibacter raozihei TaxID=2500547 RepID=UPI00293942CC|nr:lipid-A-disaccharide synthase N-terminal domain-containing protein [Apibacter raozihei]